MNLLFKFARIRVPAFLKKRELENLFTLTAKAFDRRMPSTTGMSFDTCLETYARFTENAVTEISDRDGGLARAGEKLRLNAYSLGRRLKNLFGVSTHEDVMKAARLLYRIMGIDFQGSPEGEITVTRCFFDRHYSSRTCKVMSSFDEGVLAGLSGDGNLTFLQRRTEGHSCCKAHFNFKEVTR